MKWILRHMHTALRAPVMHLIYKYRQKVFLRLQIQYGLEEPPQTTKQKAGYYEEGLKRGEMRPKTNV